MTRVEGGQERVKGEQSSLDCLKAFAESRDLRVRTLNASQREPDYLVSLMAGDGGSALIQRKSSDSLETAAFYLINTLKRLGIDVLPRPVAKEEHDTP
jgi:hypothetical protein